MASIVERQTRREAARLIRSRARTFYLSSLFFPRHIRHDVQIVYAYYRTVDDLVDAPPRGWTRADLFRTLETWERWIDGDGDGVTPLFTALYDVARRHHIPSTYLRMILDGARLDLDLAHLQTRAQLLQYSVLVAGSVGMVMAHILGARSEEALAAACDLGVAMQLTNVLRDVGEDLVMGRVYLPRDNLARAGCTLTSLRRGRITPGLRQVMHDLTDEARDLYRRGLSGIPYLDPSAQFPVFLAATLYSRILDKIERQEYDVFSRRASLGTLEKWALALPAYVQHRQFVGQYT